VERLDRAKAYRTIANLLRRTDGAAAARWDYLPEVAGLAIFGSYRDEQAIDFGDVDVLIGTRWSPELKLGGKGRIAMVARQGGG
jgi:predicted nucleotidyltransferase